MKDRGHESLSTSRWTRLTALLCPCAVFVSLISTIHLEAQSTFGTGAPQQLRTDRVDEPSPINQPPDANAQLRSKHRHSSQLNFDAANDLRQHQISDDVTKLLILARDLKVKVERLGGQPLPEKLMREAETIEIFARDIQQKMILTVGPS